MPKQKKKATPRLVGVRPTQELLEKLERQAEYEERPLATMGRIIIDRWFRDQEAKQKSA